MSTGVKCGVTIRKHPGHSSLQVLLIHAGAVDSITAGRQRNETLERVTNFLGQGSLASIGYGNLAKATLRDWSNVVLYMESADLVVMCPGWRDSPQASLLFYIAAMHGLCILEDESFKFLKLDEEVIEHTLCRPETEEYDALPEVG